MIQLFRWQDDRWDTVNVPIEQTRLSDRDTHLARFQIERTGTFRVHIQCEGFQCVADAKAEEEEEWKGIITYSPTGGVFSVVPLGDSVLSDKQQSTTLTKGHKDSSINGDKLSGQVVEVDWTCSFDVLCTSPNTGFGMFFPDIMKDQHYNFVVSYGDYTWKTMEYGTISIDIDQVNDSQGRPCDSRRGKGVPRHWKRAIRGKEQPYNAPGPAGDRKEGSAQVPVSIAPMAEPTVLPRTMTPPAPMVMEPVRRTGIEVAPIAPPSPPPLPPVPKPPVESNQPAASSQKKKSSSSPWIRF